MEGKNVVLAIIEIAFLEVHILVWPSERDFAFFISVSDRFNELGVRR